MSCHHAPNFCRFLRAPREGAQIRCETTRKLVFFLPHFLQHVRTWKRFLYSRKDNKGMENISLDAICVKPPLFLYFVNHQLLLLLLLFVFFLEGKLLLRLFLIHLIDVEMRDSPALSLRSLFLFIFKK